MREKNLMSLVEQCRLHELGHLGNGGFRGWKDYGGHSMIVILMSLLACAEPTIQPENHTQGWHDADTGDTGMSPCSDAPKLLTGGVLGSADGMPRLFY